MTLPDYLGGLASSGPRGGRFCRRVNDSSSCPEAAISRPGASNHTTCVQTFQCRVQNMTHDVDCLANRASLNRNSFIQLFTTVVSKVVLYARFKFCKNTNLKRDLLPIIFCLIVLLSCYL